MSDEQQTEGQPEKALTREEQELEDRRAYAWLDPAAIYCDHVYADIFEKGGVLRLSFGEYVSKDQIPLYRVGVALPLFKAKQLHRRLGRLLAEQKKLADEQTGEEPEI